MLWYLNVVSKPPKNSVFTAKYFTVISNIFSCIPNGDDNPVFPGTWKKIYQIQRHNKSKQTPPFSNKNLFTIQESSKHI